MLILSLVFPLRHLAPRADTPRTRGFFMPAPRSLAAGAGGATSSSGAWFASSNVRFWGYSRHRRCAWPRQLLTQRGHEPRWPRAFKDRSPTGRTLGASSNKVSPATPQSVRVQPASFSRGCCVDSTFEAIAPDATPLVGWETTCADATCGAFAPFTPTDLGVPINLNPTSFSDRHMT